MKDDRYYREDLNYDISVLQAKLEKTRTISNDERLEIIDEINQDLTIVKRKTELEKIRSDIEFEELLEMGRNGIEIIAVGDFENER
jgi:hypothetical protein